MDKPMRSEALTEPGSPLYQVLSDGVMIYTTLPVLVFAVMTEGGGQGVDDHDRVAGLHARQQVSLQRIWERLINSADMVIGQVFAGNERADVTHAIHEIHRHVGGTLKDGSRYHAWNKDLWAMTWAGIFKPVMDVYGQLRGYPSDAFRQDVYAGMLQLGAGFHVRGLPDTYEEFETYWQEQWLPAIQNQTYSARFILDTAQRPPKPAFASWLPTPLWQSITWPVRNIVRAGLLMTMPDEMESMLAIKRHRADRYSVALHRLLWKAIPKPLSAHLAKAFFHLRFKYGNPVWRTEYSPASLQQRRAMMKDSKLTCPNR